MRVDRFQELWDDGRFVGLAVRAAGTEGLWAEWSLYVFTGDQEMVRSLAQVDLRDVTRSDYVSCGVEMGLSAGLSRLSQVAREFVDQCGCAGEAYSTGATTDGLLARVGVDGRGDEDSLVVALPRHAGRLVLADADGAVCRFADYAPTPSDVLASVEWEGHSVPADMICELQDERDVRWKDCIASVLVHVACGWSGRDAEDEASVVLRGPSSDPLFDAAADAYVPMVSFDCNAVDRCDVSDDELCGVVSVRASEKLGVLRVWSDERGSYEAVISPRPYKRRPDRVVFLDGASWRLLREGFADLFGQEFPDEVCLQLRACWSDQQTVTACVARVPSTFVVNTVTVHDRELAHGSSQSFPPFSAIVDNRLSVGMVWRGGKPGVEGFFSSGRITVHITTGSRGVDRWYGNLVTRVHRIHGVTHVTGRTVPFIENSRRGLLIGGDGCQAACGDKGSFDPCGALVVFVHFDGDGQWCAEFHAFLHEPDIHGIREEVLLVTPVDVVNHEFLHGCSILSRRDRRCVWAGLCRVLLSAAGNPDQRSFFWSGRTLVHITTATRGVSLWCGNPVTRVHRIHEVMCVTGRTVSFFGDGNAPLVCVLGGVKLPGFGDLPVLVSGRIEPDCFVTVFGSDVDWCWSVLFQSVDDDLSLGFVSKGPFVVMVVVVSCYELVLAHGIPQSFPPLQANCLVRLCVGCVWRGGKPGVEGFFQSGRITVHITNCARGVDRWYGNPVTRVHRIHDVTRVTGRTVPFFGDGNAPLDRVLGGVGLTGFDCPPCKACGSDVNGFSCFVGDGYAAACFCLGIELVQEFVNVCAFVKRPDLDGFSRDEFDAHDYPFPAVIGDCSFRLMPGCVWRGGKPGVEDFFHSGRITVHITRASRGVGRWCGNPVTRVHRMHEVMCVTGRTVSLLGDGLISERA